MRLNTCKKKNASNGLERQLNSNSVNFHRQLKGKILKTCVEGFFYMFQSKNPKALLRHHYYNAPQQRILLNMLNKSKCHNIITLYRYCIYNNVTNHRTGDIKQIKWFQQQQQQKALKKFTLYSQQQKHFFFAFIFKALKFIVAFKLTA